MDLVSLLSTLLPILKPGFSFHRGGEFEGVETHSGALILMSRSARHFSDEEKSGVGLPIRSTGIRPVYNKLLLS